jgi:F0F1-type ATP synthase epsilon subunit
MTLSVEVVTRAGLALREGDLDRIVIRRREAAFDPGSEIAICPNHGPLLMQTQACRLRLTRGDSTRVVEVGAGVLEVLGNKVTLVVT